MHQKVRTVSSRKTTKPKRFRIGRVSCYVHHDSWWIYYRQAGESIRRRVGPTRAEAEQVAAQANAQLTVGSPTLFSFTPIGVAELRTQFIQYHEFVLKSTVATVRRYEAATHHLVRYTRCQLRPPFAHEINSDRFVTYLRTLDVAANGHPNTPPRRLRDNGVRFILETCRSMYSYAAKRRHLPPYAGNPFAEINIDRMKIEDAKPIFVFDAESELAFFESANNWEFPLHFVLAKTGMRVGELCHLLVEDLDLDKGWLQIRNKNALGWRVKTGAERRIPLIPAVIEVLQRVIASRNAGPVFLRERFSQGATPPLIGDRAMLEQIAHERERASSQPVSRRESLRIARTVWRDAGAIQSNIIRTSFVRIMRAIKLNATCPKSWRHTFATLMQDANVDPLIRQLTLGHKPTAHNGIGMTAVYTHTRAETQKQQIEAALRTWPRSLERAIHYAQGG